MVTFLIDTGADISLCKEGSLFFHNIDSNDVCNLSGISVEQVKSIGSTITKINFENNIIEHKIQVVENDFPINTDGI